MPPLDINREIARIRALPGGNFLALALKQIQDHSNLIVSAPAPAPSNGAAVSITSGGGSTAPSTGGGSSLPAPTPFVLSVNGTPVPGTTANLNNTWPPPPAGRLAVLFQVDTTATPPAISGSFLNTASSLLAANIVPFSATPEFDASLGQVQEITLTADVTSFTIINGIAGQFLTIIWIQDGTGGWTVSGVAGDVVGFANINLSPAAYSAQLFAYDGTNWVAVSRPVITEVTLAPGGSGNFTVAHGLAVAPLQVFVRMTTAGEIWFQMPGWDATNLYLTASAGAITGMAVCYT